MIKARTATNKPGSPQVIRRAEKGTANQCTTSKESTGAPVSAPELDSRNGEELVVPIAEVSRIGAAGTDAALTDASVDASVTALRSASAGYALSVEQ